MVSTIVLDVNAALMEILSFKWLDSKVETSFLL